MRKVSEARHTNILRGPLVAGEIKTIEDFVGILQSAQVDRVIMASITDYRTNVIGTGAQFTVYDDTGIARFAHSHLNLPSAVVKCAHLQLARGGEVTTMVDIQKQQVHISTLLMTVSCSMR